MDDNDDDDRPRPRRRPRDDDDYDPRSRRDDRPAKSSALPLVLGILAGVLVLCGGGGVAAYLFGVKPALERVRAKNAEMQREYEELERQEREALNRPPPPDPPRRPDLLKPDPAKPDRPNPPPVKPPEAAIRVTVNDLLTEYIKDPKAAESKYKDKLVRVTGEVKQTTRLSVTFAAKEDGGFTYQVFAVVGPETRDRVDDLKPGDTATVTGKLSLPSPRSVAKTKQFRLTDAKLAK